MDEILAALEAVNTITGVISLVVSAAIWIRLQMASRADARPVAVLLRTDAGRQVELPLHLTRGNLSRAEVLGRIGMIPTREAGKRFSIAALSSPAFLSSLNAAKEGRRSEVIIPASDSEIDQFDL